MSAGMACFFILELCLKISGFRDFECSSVRVFEGYHATYLRLDVDGERGKVSLEPDGVRRQRAREVDEALGIGSHAGQDRGGLSRTAGRRGGREEVVRARNAAAGRGGRKEGPVSRPLRDAVPPIFVADFVICGWRDRLGLCALRLADSAISLQSVAQTGTSIQTPPSCGLTLQG